MRDIALLSLMVRLALAQQQTLLGIDGSSGFSYQTQDNQQRNEMRYSDGTVVGNYSHNYPSGERVEVTYTAGENGYAESRQFGYGASADRTPGYRQPSRPASQTRPPGGYDNQLQELTDDWNLARPLTTTAVPYPRRPAMSYNSEDDDSYHIPTMAQQLEFTTTERPTTTTTSSYRRPTFRTTTPSYNDVYGRRINPTNRPVYNQVNDNNPSARRQQAYTHEAEQELARISAHPESLNQQQMMVLAAILAAAEGGYNLGPNPLGNVVQIRNGEEYNAEGQDVDDANSVYKKPAQATGAFPQPIVIPIILSGMQLQNTPNSVVGSRLTAQNQQSYGTDTTGRLTDAPATTPASSTTETLYRQTEPMRNSNVAPNTGYYFIPVSSRTSTPAPEQETERLNDVSSHDYDVDTYRPQPRRTTAPATTTTTTSTTTTQRPTTSNTESLTSSSASTAEPPSLLRPSTSGIGPAGIIRVPVAYFFPGSKIPYPVIQQAGKRVSQ